MNQFLAWFHGHSHHPLAPTPDNITSPAFAFPAPNDHPYVNGMKDPVEGGFVTLEEAEKYRGQAMHSGNPKLRAWATTVLPFRYAIAAAATEPAFAMSDADKKSNYFNCEAAYMFFEFLAPGQQLDAKTWCPAAGFVAGPPVEGSGKLYSAGPGLYGYSAFGPSVTPAELPAIFAAAYAAAS